MKKFKLKNFNSLTDFREYEPLTPLEAIKANCKMCYCWETKEMKQCDSHTCPFNQFLVNKFNIRRNKESRK